MPRVMLDFRVPVGGVGRYGNDLIAALKILPGSPEIRVFGRGRGLESLMRAPFTPWGRMLAGRTAQRWGADLIHGLHFELPATVAIPMVVTIQDLIPVEFPASMPGQFRRRIFNRIIDHSTAKARKVIVPSQQTARVLIDRGISEAKIATIPLGVSPHFSALSAQEIAQARSRFAKGNRYIASIYHAKPHKNLAGFAVAASIIGKSLPIICAGGQPNRSTETLRFLGHLRDPDLRLFYGGAEVFVLPSIIEGYGLPVVEALVTGTRVVCGPRVGAVDYLKDGVTVVDTTDPNQIASGIQEALESIDVEFSSPVTELTMTSVSQATVRLYETILENTS